MKPMIFNKAYQFMLVLLFSLLNIALFAQDNQGGNNNTGSTSSTTVTTESTTTTEWYSQPWVWIVGAAVLIIVLVALLRGNGSDTKEVSRTTVIKD